ncbi:MAG TPA: hypothetical protein DCW33_04000, partial [Proteobacteria bacterium]|nr:hypothetical protein [Pseudomonadota bacterium]
MHKSPITLLVFATICGSLQAVTATMTGSMKIGEEFEKGAAPSSGAWNMGDSLSFAGSGATDNGWSVSLSYLTMDNPNTTADNITTGQISYSGRFGTISRGGAGDQTLAAIDDMTPTAYEEAWGWNVSVSHTQYNTDLSDETKVQAGVTYSPAAIPGVLIVFSAAAADQFLDSGATQALAAGVRYGVDTGISGMMIGFSAAAGHAGTDHGSTNDVVNQNSWEYTTVGAAIAYAVSDDISFSCGAAHNSSSIGSADDKVSMGLGASYTYGAMTISASAYD